MILKHHQPTHDFFHIFYDNQHLNTSLPSVLNLGEAMQSGWQEAYNSCGYKYYPAFCPQKPPPKSPIIRVTGPPNAKQLRNDTTFPTIEL